MKIRLDFVTNSSSSSYMILYEIQDSPELKDWLEEEYGKFGMKLYRDYVRQGYKCREEIIEEVFWGDEEQLLNHVPSFDEGKFYHMACFVTSSDEGMTNGDDAFFANILPSKWKKNIYETESN